MSSDVQNGNNENQRLQTELTRIKVTVNDQQAKIDSLTRDNNKLSGTSKIKYIYLAPLKLSFHHCLARSCMDFIRKYGIFDNVHHHNAPTNQKQI